jgi:hypothetical protein
MKLYRASPINYRTPSPTPKTLYVAKDINSAMF